jgi:hypothetical protein
LGHSEILGVQDSPRDLSRGSKHKTSVRPSTPWWSQFDVFAREEPEEAAVRIVLVTEYSGDVLPHDDDGRLAFCGADLVDSVGE